MIRKVGFIVGLAVLNAPSAWASEFSASASVGVAHIHTNILTPMRTTMATIKSRNMTKISILVTKTFQWVSK